MRPVSMINVQSLLAVVANFPPKHFNFVFFAEVLLLLLLGTYL